ncbi:MAG TPA: dTMP kinase [Thermodesulfobacteriota bacterium]|nr:dTMP kinase [Thermodesulfobacteriota bacterium]
MSLFITFEGVEGSGKTTQMEMLKEHLEWKGFQVVSTREPGGTELGEKIRSMLLNIEGRTIAPWSELLLYAVCRAQMVNEIIKPALLDKKIVLCDRFADSTMVYQGYARGLDLEAVTNLNKWVTEGILPTVTFIIDCPPEIGLKRALARIDTRAGSNKEDRFEREDIEFHKKVREGYLKLAKTEPNRIKIINGDRDIPVIHKEICGIIEKKLGGGVNP